MLRVCTDYRTDRTNELLSQYPEVKPSSRPAVGACGDRQHVLSLNEAGS